MTSQAGDWEFLQSGAFIVRALDHLPPSLLDRWRAHARIAVQPKQLSLGLDFNDAGFRPDYLFTSSRKGSP